MNTVTYLVGGNYNYLGYITQRLRSEHRMVCMIEVHPWKEKGVWFFAGNKPLLLSVALSEWLKSLENAAQEGWHR